MWETSSYRQNMCEQFFNLSFAWEDFSILPNFFNLLFKILQYILPPQTHAKGRPKVPHFQGPTAQTPATVESVEAMVF